MTVVCIAGMHRSGTSMIARLLNLCGVYLGPDADIIVAAQDNPEGFWENVKFVQINDEILSRQKGAWDKPPRVAQGWEKRRELSSLRARTQDLLKQFSGQRYWGWKDPRNSLTLPYWKRFLPDLKVIICLRNPLEVARSLARRGYASNTFSFDLWQTHNQRVLSAAASGKYLITHYNSYFIDPRAELRRLLKFIGLSINEELLQAACNAASSALRHHQSTIEDLIAAKPSADVLRLYLEMCSQAGPVYWGPLRPSLQKVTQTQAGRQYSPESALGLLVRLTEERQALQALSAQLAEKESTQTVQALTAQVSEKEQAVQVLATQVIEKEQAYRAELENLEIAHQSAIKQKNQTLNMLLSRLAAREQEIRRAEQDKQRILENLAIQTQEAHTFSAQVWEIKHSRAWRLILLIWSLRTRWFPAGSIQARLARLFKRSFQVVRGDGWKMFFKHAFNKISTRIQRGTTAVSVMPPASDASSASTFEVRPNPVINPVYVPDHKIRVARDVLPAAPSQRLSTNDATDLWERIVSCMKHDDFVLSISHDNYLLVNFGGIQMFMGDEQRLYDDRKLSYIHLYPVGGADFLEASRADFAIGLNVDSTQLGKFTAKDILAMINRLRENGRCKSMNVHHLRGWNLNDLNAIIVALEPAFLLYYIHDFFAICPQHNLLRNNNEFCHAPSVESNVCRICQYGDRRMRQLPLIGKWFSEHHFTIIAPSESAKATWLGTFGGASNEIKIVPHLLTKETPRPSPVRLKDEMRIAYAGQGEKAKGWVEWRALVDRLSSQSEYQFYRLGLYSGVHFEKFEPVRVTLEERTAMLDALCNNQIDILFHWPIWPETFSFVLYEAIAAGCFILTSNKSGNVADYVQRFGNGIVFETLDELADYLADPQAVRKDLLDFRARFPREIVYELNESVANMIEPSI